ncbi:hypothetical protein [Streptomyces sp. ST2-7A]|uniref:hypothetical protein n=1 Tax=Streptomyces sp. ST2-7A TaxID=2907214 RepID=UPI001F40C510|nr:hypothetical protein [Streptomyces sp. ST2-7A]MCE7082844.1 hypothetical protein [Streptomyces sp. ST2-7A]
MRRGTRFCASSLTWSPTTAHHRPVPGPGRRLGRPAAARWRRWRGAAHLFPGLGNAALHPRHRYGTDGADQASTLVQGAVGPARLLNDPRTRDALLWYVVAQSDLSYPVSGWVKSQGKGRRSGAALGGVMRTRTYGQEDVWRLTTRYPRAAHTLAHGVPALECLFPSSARGAGNRRSRSSAAPPPSTSPTASS